MWHSVGTNLTLRDKRQREKCELCDKRIWWWQSWAMHGGFGERIMHTYHKSCFERTKFYKVYLKSNTAESNSFTIGE